MDDSHSDSDDVVRLLGRHASRTQPGDGADSAGGRATRTRQPLPGVLARVDRAPFVGRTEQVAELDRCRRAAERGGRLVVLTGEPGIGKTRLAARLAASVAAQGDAVLYGRADEESVSPFQPFVEALRY
jgi:predicted ATP-dependent serine protease